MDNDIRTREHTLPDGKMIVQRLCEIDDQLNVWAPEHNCFFCGHCKGVLYDYEYGLYASSCSEDEDGIKDLQDDGYYGRCEYFEEDASHDPDRKKFIYMERPIDWPSRERAVFKKKSA